MEKIKFSSLVFSDMNDGSKEASVKCENGIEIIVMWCRGSSYSIFIYDGTKELDSKHCLSLFDAALYFNIAQEL